MIVIASCGLTKSGFYHLGFNKLGFTQIQGLRHFERTANFSFTYTNGIKTLAFYNVLLCDRSDLLKPRKRAHTNDCHSFLWFNQIWGLRHLGFNKLGFTQIQGLRHFERIANFSLTYTKDIKTLAI